MMGPGPLPRVHNAHKTGRSVAGAVYAGRPGPWGNPFSLGKDGSRDEVICLYIDWLHDNPDFVARVRTELAGKDLVCWCDPLPCHAHILRDLAAGAPLPQRRKPAQGSLFGD